MRIKFVVPGAPVGFKTTTKRGKYSKTYQKYVAYKELVQLHAKMAGIKLPLVATEEKPLMIRTVSFFGKDARHPDPGNVQKGVCDALFYDPEKAAIAKMKGKKGKFTGKGDDKYTGGSFPPPLYDFENPRVIVIIKGYKPPEGYTPPVRKKKRTKKSSKKDTNVSARRTRRKNST